MIVRVLYTILGWLSNGKIPGDAKAPLEEAQVILEKSGVGGDAYIAPVVKCPDFHDIRRIRNIPYRADVGIGPYGNGFAI